MATSVGKDVAASPAHVDEANHSLAEQPLRAGEEYFRALVRGAFDAVQLVDENNRIFYVSPAVSRVLGYQPEEMLGQTGDQYVHPEDLALCMQGFGELIERPGHNQLIELRVRHQDGAYRWLEIHATNLLAEPAVRAVVVNYRDISERKRNQLLLAQQARELARSNADLLRFAQVASHDLQEPLRKVQLFGSRLQERHGESLPQDGADDLRRMIEAADRAQRLITGVLEYSRIASEPRHYAPVDLGAVVRDVLSDLEPLISEKGAQITVTALPTIEADRTQMLQMFLNLITNSLKFVRPGVPPRITISADGPRDAAAPKWRVVVADDGIGFDEKYLEKLFVPFARLHARSDFEGTGIGLAICRRVAEAHGGSITASSESNNGARFVIELAAKPEA